ALLDDRRLERAERVDAPVDDVARYLHRLADAVTHPGLGLAHDDLATIGHRHLPVGTAETAGLADLPARDPSGGFELGRIDNEADFAIAGGQLADLDVCAPQLLIQDLLHILAAGLRDILRL